MKPTRQVVGPLSRRPSSPCAQRGLTLVELMVSVVLALLVTLAALAALLFSRQSSTAMEQAAALRDSARFSTELIRRVVQQAGFESVNENSQLRQGFSNITAASNQPDIEGVNNALVAANADPTKATHGNRTSACGTVSDTRCVNGSDVLILRFQGLADGSMVSCAGAPVHDALTEVDRPMSAFHVQVSASGEPTLTCTSRNPNTGAFEESKLIEGVESFQVLYGVDAVAPNAVTASSEPEPTVISRYLRADQIVVPSNVAATQDNWRRVRAIRIGMVLRGPLGSGLRGAHPATLFPLGAKLQSAEDAFSAFTVPDDGRLRQEVTFTVHLRNYQGQKGRL